MKRLLFLLLLLSSVTYGQRLVGSKATPGASVLYQVLLASDVPSNFLRSNATNTLAGDLVIDGVSTHGVDFTNVPQFSFGDGAGNTFSMNGGFSYISTGLVEIQTSDIVSFSADGDFGISSTAGNTVIQANAGNIQMTGADGLINTWTSQSTGSVFRSTLSGSATNIGFEWLNKGTAFYHFRGNSSQSTRIQGDEDTDSGADTGTIIWPQSLTSDRTWTFPDATGTISLTSDLSAYQPLAANLTTLSTNGTAGYKVQMNSGGTAIEYAPQLTNPATTDQDLIIFNGTSFDRIPVGSNGDVLTVTAGVVDWAAGGGGGAVDDVTGTAPISVSPTTGSVVVSIADAAADGATKGAAAFNATYFDATTGVVTIDATNGVASSSQAGYIPTVSSTAGTFLRSTATASGWSTLVLPNAITANHVMYGTSTNNVGTSANLQFTGTTLNVTGGIVGSTGVVNSTAAGSNNGITSIRSGTLTANNVNSGFLSNGNYTLRSTGADINYINRINNGVTTGNSSQVIHINRIDPSIVANHATTTINGIVYDPALSGTNIAGATHTGLHIVSGATIINSLRTAYVAKTALYTLTESDYTVEVTSGTHTQTLPTAVGIPGRVYVITNSGSGTVTVGTTSSQTFVNVTATPTTLTLLQFQTVTVQSNGANWLRISTL